MASKQKSVVEISNGGTTAKINTDNSQMFSLERKGTQTMWPGGAPDGQKPGKGWQNSELVMFPIVGPTPVKEGILIKGKEYPMVQHGLSRDLPWIVMESTPDRVTMVQVYEAGLKVEGKKGTSVFPCSYEITKRYSIDGQGILRFSLTIENTGNNTLPYAVGWHPAFRALEDGYIYVTNGNDKHGITASAVDVKESPRNVIVFKNSNKINYVTKEFSIVFGHNFGSSQAWNTGDGLIAIEPITAEEMAKPISGVDAELSSHVGYMRLAPGKSKTFEAQISVFVP